MTSVAGQQQPTLDSREVHFNSSQDQQQASAVLDYSTVAAPSAVTNGNRVLPSHSHSWMHPPPLPPQPGTLPTAATTVTMSANSLYALNDQQQQQPTPSCLQQQLQQQAIKVPSTSVGGPGSTGLLMNVMYPPPPPPPPPSSNAMPPPNSSGSAGSSQAPQGPLPPPPPSASPGAYGHKQLLSGGPWAPNLTMSLYLSSSVGSNSRVEIEGP